MLAFAFALAGLTIALILGGFRSASYAMHKSAMNRKYQEKDQRVKAMTASAEEIKKAGEPEYEDVYDDIRYISGDENLDDLSCRYKARSYNPFVKSAIPWKDVVINIRLARKGLVSDNYFATSGILTTLRTPLYDAVWRYYTVLSKYYTQAGIPAQVVQNDIYNTQLTKINLSIFVVQ